MVDALEGYFGRKWNRTVWSSENQVGRGIKSKDVKEKNHRKKMLKKREYCSSGGKIRLTAWVKKTRKRENKEKWEVNKAI